MQGISPAKGVGIVFTNGIIGPCIGDGQWFDGKNHLIIHRIRTSQVAISCEAEGNGSTGQVVSPRIISRYWGCFISKGSIARGAPQHGRCMKGISGKVGHVAFADDIIGARIGNWQWIDGEQQAIAVYGIATGLQPGGFQDDPHRTIG